MSKRPSKKESSTPEEVKLIERMVERENMLKAYSRVMRNKGSAGIDKMSVEELKPYLQERWPKLKAQLLAGEYRPKAVRGVEIPKPNGGKRQLGIPTVVDRLIQQALHQIRAKLKLLFRQGRGRNLCRFIQENLNPIIKGWINYFKLAEVKCFAEELDGWIRRRLRLILWRQWKRPWTRRKRLMKAGLSEERAVQSAFNRRGPWWNSGALHMSAAFPKRYFEKCGLVSMLDEICRFRYVNFRNRLGT